MIRRIITINEDRCNGCGLCVDACHEGAIELVEGKARLIKDDYCDGLGDCLPACPQDAISFEEREAAPYNEELVKERLAEQGKTLPPQGCPGMQSRTIEQSEQPFSPASPAASDPVHNLNQWPIQIKLAPITADYFDGADLLIAADCTAFAYAGFHSEFLGNKITLIGCPKLDSVDYAEKLGAILSENTIRSITVLRMQVPCCGGLENAVMRAVSEVSPDTPVEVVTISVDGKIV